MFDLIETGQTYSGFPGIDPAPDRIFANPIKNAQGFAYIRICPADGKTPQL